MPNDRPETLSFQMGCFVVAEFLLTSNSCGPSAIAEPLVDQNCSYGLVAKHSRFVANSG